MTLPRELSDEVNVRVQELCQRGDAFMEADKLEEACTAYEQALECLPRPVEEWEAGTWILGAIGDALFQLGRHHEAIGPLRRALKCPGGLENAFLHLRLGQCLIQEGHRRLGADELARAYMLGGDELFECEAAIYRDVLSVSLKPSASC